MVIPAFSGSFRGMSFSGGAVYKINKIKLRGNVSSGFRAPNTTELLSNGVHHGTNRYIKGDDVLGERKTQLKLIFLLTIKLSILSFQLIHFIMPFKTMYFFHQRLK